MANVFDVAKYILEKRGEMTAMKLQKLVFYSQAWSLVWDDEALFNDVIQAWSNGPVVPNLYDYHRGKFLVIAENMPGNSSNLSDGQRETINAVLATYGDKSAQWLVELTHSETPWKDARGSLDAGERGSNPITLDKIVEYYSII